MPSIDWAPPNAGHEPHRKLAAILSADAVGYSRLMHADEPATVETLNAYRAAMRRVIERHKGRVVNVPGDALLAQFASVVEAVSAAVEIQQALEGRNMELAPERRDWARVVAQSRLRQTARR
jgi:adenylate cyclase